MAVDIPYISYHMVIDAIKPCTILSEPTRKPSRFKWVSSPHWETGPFVVFGGIWTGITMSALSLCTTLPMFYAVGCLIGLGFFGCSYAAVPVIVNAWFVEKNGFVMGLAAACGGGVAVILSLVFPTAIEALGWQAGYVLLGTVVFVLTTPAGVFLLKSNPADAGLGPFGAKSDSPATLTGNLPGIPYRQALKMPQLWAILLAFLLLAVTVTVTQHLAAYFVSVGFNAVMAGVFMSVISGGLIITSSCAGIVADKLGLIKTLSICSARPSARRCGVSRLTSRAAMRLACTCQR